MKHEVDEAVLERHRQRMVEGLAAAIREKGLAHTQVADIVRHAKASRSTFYNCFEDRDACFLALAQSMFELTRNAVASAIDPAAPWDAQVDQAIDAFLATIDSDRAVTVTFSNDLPMLGARGARLRAESNEKYAELLVAFAQNPGAVKAGVSGVTMEKAVMLMTGIEGIINRAVRRDEDLLDLAPVAKDVIKRAVAP